MMGVDKNGCPPKTVRPLKVSQWRKMTQSDLVSVKQISDLVHQDYPEDASIFADRLYLYPAGCLVLEIDRTLRGYAIGHPWLYRQPPALNTRLDSLPPHPDAFHIHDLALMSEARGTGLGTDAIAYFVNCAKDKRLEHVSLISVGTSLVFWQRHKFALDNAEASLSTYGKRAVYMTRRLPLNERRVSVDKGRRSITMS